MTNLKMVSRIKKKELLELKTDLKLLLECLDYQKDDITAVKQSLVTISSMLQGSDEAKDVFRDIGGVQEILTLVTNNGPSDVTETGLYCLGCAVERNVYSQKLLTTASVFTFLHGILSSSCKASVRKKQTASFLLLCLVSNNGFGQNLARQSSCLQDILSLIKTTLPRNIEDLDSDWFEGMDGKSLHLWSTLLSTTCSCVNNPMNEGNQRICASLLPYLFSLLTSQSDERIIRPILSLIGLTVSGNESNQDRVRKCGGLDIFVKKLGKLQNEAVCNIAAKTLTIQLLSTVDSCISDNEKNSKGFGEFGGIKLVLALLAECCLDPSEKIQAVLTLAHALDACKLNQKYVKDCGGVTILIQQLTETQDEEFSKTIKYLLHMCVTSDKDNMSEIETNLTDTERLIDKMEAMKKHNDVAMLKKIKELDSKVKSMENKQQQDFNQDEIVTTSFHPLLERFGSPPGMSPHDVESAQSQTGSHGEHALKRDCPTPREKSLMEQLIKEKVEKERLEKLNHMLQENICKTNTALTHARVENKSSNECTQSSNQQQSSNVQTAGDISVSRNNGLDISSSLKDAPNQSATAFNLNNRSYPISSSHNERVSYGNTDVKYGGLENGNLLNQNRLRNDKFSSSDLPKRSHDHELPLVTRSGLRYKQSDISESNNRTENSDCNNNSIERNELQKLNLYQFDRNNNISKSKDNYCNKNFTIDQLSSSFPRNLENEFVQQKNNPVNCTDSFPYVAKPLDLSCSDKPSNTVTDHYDISEKSKNCANRNNNKITEIVTMATKETEKHPATKVGSTNAEIQCGTPWINKNSDNEKMGNESYSSIDGSSQTNFNKQTPNMNNLQQSEISKGKRLLINKSDNPAGKFKQIEVAKSLSCDGSKTPIVVLTDCDKIKESHGTQHETNTSLSRTSGTSPSRISTCSQKSAGLFVKPCALPPKRKIRVTPLLGADKLPGARFLLSKTSGHNNINNSSQSDEYDSDVQSEFDLNLLKRVARQPAPVRTTPVIKSQNNVKRIDKVVEKRGGNAAENWQVHPSTPHRQGIVPLRPAFSDCGTRRCVLSTSFSTTSQGNRRRSLDDSGIHSPRDILTISPKSPEGSPVDSNIDGFRSSSDMSDEEDGPPNISAAVLRSSKKLVKHKDENKCPGCSGVYSASQDTTGGLELNSRTYNIALETNQNTCALHRKLRQVERVYINKIRKTKGLRHKLKRKMQYKKAETRNGEKLREKIFEFSSESADNISPPSEDNEEFQPPSRNKRRRKRIPYTLEEENNLLEGVRKLGKHWNQILVTYDFHPARTNIDLMDKYKRLSASSNQDTTSSKCLSLISRPKTLKPFSMCEERRLRRGIMKFGYNWKTILSSFTFAQGRTTEDLRNKWRTLHKKM